MEHDQELRKRDIPILYSGIVAKVIAVGAPASILYGSFTDTAFWSWRPGILDGIIGGCLGLLIGWAFGRTEESMWRHSLLEMKARSGLLRYIWLRQLKPLFPLCFFGSIALSSGIGWLLYERIGLRWPLVGLKPWIDPGFLGFFVALYCRYAMWYDNLPD
ncbi:MAG: hypothetical protein M1133_13945 [Armatimonadetes bacterium]|nr:hypothetical protein [Armatimonadota bacterium]